jgi:hypothetical protein
MQHLRDTYLTETIGEITPAQGATDTGEQIASAWCEALPRLLADDPGPSVDQ